MVKESVQVDQNKKESLLDSVKTVTILPVYISLMICLLQQCWIAMDTKKHLIEIYRGECEFVKKAKNLKNASIAGNSFHFGGYLIGYLLWVKKI